MTKNPERGENNFENSLSWNWTLAFGSNFQRNPMKPFSGDRDPPNFDGKILKQIEAIDASYALPKVLLKISVIFMRGREEWWYDGKSIPLALKCDCFGAGFAPWKFAHHFSFIRFWSWRPWRKSEYNVLCGPFLDGSRGADSVSLWVRICRLRERFLPKFVVT